MGHVGYVERLDGCLLVDCSVPRRECDRPPVAVRVVEEVRVADRLHWILSSMSSIPRNQVPDGRLVLTVQRRVRVRVDRIVWTRIERAPDARPTKHSTQPASED